jgi:photosystem II stability/assembly factor-like uncharacterized protein
MKIKFEKATVGEITLLARLLWVLALSVCLGTLLPLAVAADDWTPRNGPEGGYVARIAVDYADSNLVYLANWAGIHKSTNGGTGWTNLNAYFGIAKIVLDRTSRTTVYVVGGPIFKSTDAGANWVILDTKLTCNDAVQDIVLDPNNAATIYGIVSTRVGTNVDYSVIKSTNGGTSWSTLTWKAYGLAIDPTNSNVFYASTPSGLQKSTDGGGTFTPAGTGLPTGQTLGTVVVDPKTPATLYLTVGDALYKSTNGGGQWQLSNTGISGKNLTAPTIDPLTPANLYVIAKATSNGQGILYKTTNGGAQWNAVNLGIPTADAQVVTVDPSNPAILYVGTLHHGVLKSTNSGTNWTLRNTGLKALIQYMVLDPANKNTIYAGIPGLGVFQSTDGGSNWTARNAGLGSQMVAALAISPVGNRTLWASVNNAVEQDLGGGLKFFFPGVYKSTNGGASWTLATMPADNFGFLAPAKLAADPVDPNGIYALGAAGTVYHSTDAGSTWSSSNTGLPSSVFLNSIAVDPKTPSTVYVGLFAATTGTPLIYKSTNSGVSWSASGNGLPNAQGIFDLAIDPKTPSNLFAALVVSINQSGTVIANGGVFKSVDSGGSWQDTTSGIAPVLATYAGTQYGNITYAGQPLNCPTQNLITAFNLAIDANTPSTLFAIVNGFVVRTTNAGGSYSLAHSGLPFSPYQIGISPADSTTAYTGHLGVWVYTGTGGGGGGGGGTPALTVTSPNGGENWAAGSVRNITWTTTGTVANVKIEVSTDGGSSFTTIVASTANTGSYSWTVPNTPASTCKIRVSDAAGTASGTSSGNFTIAAAGACTYAISPSSRSFGLSGGTGSVAVTAGAGCAWTATSNASWLTITSGASGTGNGSVNYSVASASAARSATLTIGGQTFTVTQAASTGISSGQFVPVALSLSGIGGSFYTTELTFTNRGTTTANVELSYVATTGAGTGSASIAVPPGQSIFSNAIEYLRAQGLPIPDSGNRLGTLRALFSNLSAASAAGITARTTTLVRDGSGNSIGRAGLAYAAITSGTVQSISEAKAGRVAARGEPGDTANLASVALTAPAHICGLRQNSTDRSNVAFQNVGSASEGSITLRVTVFDGDSSNSSVLDPIILDPGAFYQIGGVLTSSGLNFSNGYIKVERISGTAPYYAYGVINDQVNSDGSFVIPQLAASSPVAGLTLPVIVQTTAFLSELVITNFSSQARSLNFSFVADAVTTPDKTARFTINLTAGQQQIIPDIFTYMRNNSVAGIGPEGTTIAGALFATAAGGDLSGVVLGARTSASGGSAGGRFGLFYTAVPYGRASTNSAWVFGLQQNSENRTNLAIVNTGETDAGSNTFVIDLYDGATGAKVKSLDPITLPARGWTQIGTILNNAPGVQQGYAEVRRTAGGNPFITYAVINDGAGPGQRTGDGAYIGSTD